jgi:hypothetical protein
MERNPTKCAKSAHPHASLGYQSPALETIRPQQLDQASALENAT